MSYAADGSSKKTGNEPNIGETMSVNSIVKACFMAKNSSKKTEKYIILV